LLRPLEFGEPVAIAGATVRLQTAGHILGSASVVLDVDGRRVVFSGDLGRPVHPLLRPPTPVPNADVVVVESTYGDRSHDPLDEVGDRLGRIVSDTVRRCRS